MNARAQRRRRVLAILEEVVEQVRELERPVLLRLLPALAQAHPARAARQQQHRLRRALGRHPPVTDALIPACGYLHQPIGLNRSTTADP